MLADSPDKGEIPRLAGQPLALGAVTGPHHLADPPAERHRLVLGAPRER